MRYILLESHNPLWNIDGLNVMVTYFMINPGYFLEHGNGLLGNKLIYNTLSSRWWNWKDNPMDCCICESSGWQLYQMLFVRCITLQLRTLAHLWILRSVCNTAPERRYLKNIFIMRWKNGWTSDMGSINFHILPQIIRITFIITSKAMGWFYGSFYFSFITQ